MARSVYELDIDLSPLHELNQEIQQLLKGLNTQQLDKAKKEIGKYIRSSMRKRITRQENVDGTAFKARKPLQPWEFGGLREQQKRGRLRKKMLTGFRDKAKVGIEIEGDKIRVGYFGWSGQLAYFHNEGIAGSQLLCPPGMKDAKNHNRCKVKKKRYSIPRPARNWVGVSKDDEREIQTILQKILVN